MSFLSRLVKFWVVITFIGLSAYFAVYNRDAVALSLPPWIEHLSVPGYMVFMAFFVIGAFVACVFFLVEHMRKSLEIRRLRKEVAQLTARATTVSTSPSYGAGPSADILGVTP